jgi:hypothetical protein
MTDVGARCPVCAPRRKLPQLEVGPLYLVRGITAALAVGAALGAAWGVLLGGSLGFISIFLGIGLGYCVAESVSLATNRKFGAPLQVAAAAGVVLAYVARNLATGDTAVPANDFFGYVTVLVAVVVAVNRLRY